MMKKLTASLLLTTILLTSDVQANIFPTLPASVPTETNGTESFPDVIENAIREQLGLSMEEQLFDDQLKEIEGLALENMDITDLHGLEKCISLKELYLNGSTVQDLSALAGLKKLEIIWAENCQIENISPLSGMENLKELSLLNNAVTDLSPIADKTHLNLLILSGNPITDITPLSGLTGLKTLMMKEIKAHDFSALSDLINLEDLDLTNTGISDLTVLQNMKELKSLNAGNNSITDISVLGGLTRLNTLNIEGNDGITDLDHIAGLKLENYAGPDLERVEDECTKAAENISFEESGKMSETDESTSICPFCDHGECIICGGRGYDKCGTCFGTGRCPSCNGSCEKRGPGFGGVGTAFYYDCFICGGSGDCPDCGGDARIPCEFCDNGVCPDCHGDYEHYKW